MKRCSSKFLDTCTDVMRVFEHMWRRKLSLNHGNTCFWCHPTQIHDFEYSPNYNHPTTNEMKIANKKGKKKALLIATDNSKNILWAFKKFYDILLQQYFFNNHDVRILIDDNLCYKFDNASTTHIETNLKWIFSNLSDHDTILLVLAGDFKDLNRSYEQICKYLNDIHISINVTIVFDIGVSSKMINFLPLKYKYNNGTIYKSRKRTGFKHRIPQIKFISASYTNRFYRGYFCREILEILKDKKMRINLQTLLMLLSVRFEKSNVDIIPIITSTEEYTNLREHFFLLSI